MENSVAVVSFSERYKDFHLNLARSVTSNFEIHQVYLGGMTNISTIGLPSKVTIYSLLYFTHMNSEILNIFNAYMYKFLKMSFLLV